VDDNEKNDGPYKVVFGNQMFEEPKVNMMFDSEEDVVLYYMQYAK
jgi:hypothetical protein